MRTPGFLFDGGLDPAFFGEPKGSSDGSGGMAPEDAVPKFFVFLGLAIAGVPVAAAAIALVVRMLNMN